LQTIRNLTPTTILTITVQKEAECGNTAEQYLGHT